MEITQRLLDWYDENARPFPWRSEAIDPYVVLLSETMLQQTQASRVAEYLPRFLALFPNVQTLASATNGEILRSWKGMGYNSRALRLRDAAKVISEQYAGVVPRDTNVLRSLPGVGPYTSAAITCFAYNTYVVVLDVNVRRVYSRLHSTQSTTADVLPDDTLALFAASVIPATASARWHHAVMDLGATICTARLPTCSACPLSDLCPSANLMTAKARARRSEPTFRGEPRRLWRGRVVEHLRGNTGSGISIARLASVLFGIDHHDEDVRWLTELVAALQKDGLVKRRGRGISLAD